MRKINLMNIFPKRPDQHVLDNKASKYLESKIPDEWIHESVKNDYGLDYTIGIVNKGNVLGPNFSIQLKGKKNISKKKQATTQIKKSTLNYWNNRFEPTLVVIYCDTEKNSYYRWFDKTEFDLTSSQEEFSFNIEKSNILESIDWQRIQDEIIELFTLKHRLYHLYSISLSKLKNTEFDQIWSAYMDGKFEDTIEYCKGKLNQEENVLWHAILSHAYYAISQLKLGLYHNQKALSILSNETETDKSIISELSHSLKTNRASILAELGSETGNKFYLFEAADIWVELIEKEKIVDSDLFYNFANTCLLLQKLEIAKIYFLKSLSLYNNNPKAWTNLADVYGFMENFQEELKCYRKAIKIDNTLKNALIGEAIALFHLGNFKDSLSKFLDLKKYEKEWQIHYSDYYYYLSEVYENLGQSKKSVTIAEEGIIYDPGNINLINKLSKIYSNRWENDIEIKEKAKKLYLKRLQVFTDDLKALGELVNMKIRDGESEKGIADFVRFHILLEEGVTDKEIVESFRK